MGQRLLDALSTLPAPGAYAALFALTFLETAAFAGFVVPGETAVVLCGVLAGRGVLSLPLAVTLASLGAILGDTVGYALGRRLGAPFVLRWGRYVRVRPHHLADAERFFERHGGKAVLFGRFAALLRALAPVVAGLSRMPYGRFLVYNVVGGVLWAGAFTLLGFVVGQSWEVAGRWLGHAALLAVVFGAATAYALSLIHRRRRWLAVRTSRLDRALAARYPAAWPPIRERFTPGARYGLRLTMALVAVALGFYSFTEVVELWAGVPALNRLDALGQRAVGSLGLVPTAKAVAHLGGGVWTAVVGVAVAIWLARSRSWWLGAWVATLAGGEGLVWAAKTFFHRAQPTARLILDHGYSFPSRHAAVAVLLYGFAAAYAWVHLRGAPRTAVVTLMAGLVLAVGLSQMVLGVHYATDVLGGAVLSVTWLVVALALARTFAADDDAMAMQGSERVGRLLPPVAAQESPRLSNL